MIHDQQRDFSLIQQKHSKGNFSHSFQFFFFFFLNQGRNCKERLKIISDASKQAFYKSSASLLWRAKALQESNLLSILSITGSHILFALHLGTEGEPQVRGESHNFATQYIVNWSNLYPSPTWKFSHLVKLISEPKLPQNILKYISRNPLDISASQKILASLWVTTNFINKKNGNKRYTKGHHIIHNQKKHIKPMIKIK